MKVYKLNKSLKYKSPDQSKTPSGKITVRLVRYGVTAAYDKETAEKMIREGKAVRA